MCSANSIARVRFGVPGLDDVLPGGIPGKTLFLIQGTPGSGKTTIALQFLLQGAQDGESCLYVTNAETQDQLATIAASHGWRLDGIRIMEWREQVGSVNSEDWDDEASDYTLFPEAEVEVSETLAHLFAEVERLRPARLVIDTVSTLRVLAPTPAFYRRQLRRVRDFLCAHSCTTLLVDDAAAGEKDVRSQTIADGLLELEHIDFQYGGDRRRLRVRKLRGCSYIGGLHDFRIKTGGVVVYPRLIAGRHEAILGGEPAASGIHELDSLTGGGLPRGSSTLIIGPAGSGKSTLATAYMHAAAARGERSAICLFDESPEAYVARSRGLGFPIDPLLETGQIRMTSIDPGEYSPGEISHLVVQFVEEEDARFIVLDTLNGYLYSAAEEPMVLLHLRQLLSFLARRQVISLLVLTQHGILGAEMAAPVDVSYLADNVLLLRYFEAAGSIRQAVSILKKRTGKHERTIRELFLTSQGMSLSQPLKDFSGVLEGTPHFNS